ncbi:MAG: hypothetical protein PHP42_09105 [Bacteroidota bacterium]|nr:hypothetical protein [Bacteroidota bacterium]
MKYLIFAALLSLFTVGCSTESENKKTTQFIVKVDSIAKTPFAALGDTIEIKLYGTIGTDGCSSFLRLDETKQPLRVDVTAWGQRVSSGVCPDVMVYLDSKETKAIATQMGLYSINIHQPDGSVLRDSLVIK